MDFASGTVMVHTRSGITHRLAVEIAESDMQRERGLMYRTSLPDERGMLFVYPAAQWGGFWMFNTKIPLSVAYADADGVIVQITDMSPCLSQEARGCPQDDYRAVAPFQYGLEANQGYFAARGIGVGDRIEYQRESP
ncbi:DUF192 domain-containing protein [Pseudomonas sp. LjRoot71]|uniref:DUF192 domain-containing protein n=1 Tax=Pseudomonas sp. LjRoot71 TaxID=3342336 RepID=UPI003ECE8678